MRRNTYYLVPLRRERGQELSPWSQSGGASGSFGASPWRMMRQMQDEMDRIFGQLLTAPAGYGGETEVQAGLQHWSPSVDISESENEWCLEAEFPGVRRDDIDVEVRDDYLIIRAELRPEEPQQGETAQEESRQAQSGGGQGRQRSREQGQQRQYHQRERRWGYFERVLPLPDNVDSENIGCEFENGVLTLHLPKTAPQRQEGRRIPIGTSREPQRGREERAGERALAGAKGGEAGSEPSEGEAKAEKKGKAKKQ